MELSELELIDQYSLLPKKALFFAGIIKADSGLELSIILKFLKKLYEKDLDVKVLNEIESALYTGKIGSAKEILDKISKNCGICKKPADLATTLLCNHNFHQDCWKAYCLAELYNDQELKCPICRIKIDDSSLINKEVMDQYNDFQLSKQFSHKNCKNYPSCNQLIESDPIIIKNCKACEENICRSIGNIEKICDKDSNNT